MSLFFYFFIAKISDIYLIIFKMSYHQIYLHCIFATKYRQQLLHPKHDDELQKYITGIVQNRQCKMMAINNVEDHLHMLVALHPSYPPAKLMQEVKANSAKFINESDWYSYKFQWQGGYACFSYAQSEVKNVSNYIFRQKEHHRKTEFKDEYLWLLQKFHIPYDEKYVFE